MFEIELKAIVKKEQMLIHRLAEMANGNGHCAVYQDQYFDTNAKLLKKWGREIRIRKIAQDGMEQFYITAKSNSIAGLAGSRHEYELAIVEPQIAENLLATIGFERVLALTKRCRNYSFIYQGHRILATLSVLVGLPQTFLEVETLVLKETDTSQALIALKQLMTSLGIDEHDITTRCFSDLLEE
jgi:predicted adenylyl cyclase CyaB